MATAQEITLTNKDGSKLYYPHTEASLVKDSETGKTVKEQLDTLGSKIDVELNGGTINPNQPSLPSNVILEPNVRYAANGKTTNANYASTNILPEGTYTTNALTGDYWVVMFSYDEAANTCVSKRTKTQVALTFESDGTFVLCYQKGTTAQSLTEEDLAYFTSMLPTKQSDGEELPSYQVEGIKPRLSVVEQNVFNTQKDITSIKGSIKDIDKALSEFSGTNITEQYDVSSGAKLNKKIGGLNGGTVYNVKVETSETAITKIDIFAYNGTTLIGKILADGINSNESYEIVFPDDATDIQFISKTAVVSSSANFTVSIKTNSLSDIVENNKKEIEQIKGAIFEPTNDVVFCASVNKDALVEMYFPNMTSAWKINSIAAKEDYVSLGLIDENGTALASRYGGVNDGNKNGLDFTDKILKFYRGSEVIGYYVIHYNGTEYAQSFSGGKPLNIDLVVEVNNSPRIKEYLSRKENIVLLGDSLFGYNPQNALEQFLISYTDKMVFNGGFSGCRAAERDTGKASDPYWNKLSLVGVADAIYNESFADQESAIANIGASYSYFNQRLANLKICDFSKPTTIFINYGNNDITGGSPIGDMYEDGAEYARNTYLGGLNYGFSKILAKYPHIKIVYVTQGWRRLGTSVSDDGGTSGTMVVPSQYRNPNGVTFVDFVDAAIENCAKANIRVFDMFRMGGRTAFNFAYYSVDTSHFNAKGYKMFAKSLANEDKQI